MTLMIQPLRTLQHFAESVEMTTTKRSTFTKSRTLQHSSGQIKGTFAIGGPGKQGKAAYNLVNNKDISSFRIVAVIRANKIGTRHESETRHRRMARAKAQILVELTTSDIRDLHQETGSTGTVSTLLVWVRYFQIR